MKILVVSDDAGAISRAEQLANSARVAVVQVVQGPVPFHLDALHMASTLLGLYKVSTSQVSKALGVLDEAGFDHVIVEGDAGALGALEAEVRRFRETQALGVVNLPYLEGGNEKA